MSNVIPFQFDNITIRAIEIDGAPWFIGKDIAEALGYANAADAVSKHCKGVAKRYPLQTAGGLQEVRIINEPDLYRLIVKSQLPDAQRFERWVFEEVLPAIRKTGSYGAAKPVVKDPRTAALIEALQRQDAIEQEQERQSTEIARLQEDLAVVEARTQPDSKHFTVLGYANLIGRPINLQQASAIGRKCATRSKDLGISIGDMPDPRFGRVHTYHESILIAVMAEIA